MVEETKHDMKTKDRFFSYFNRSFVCLFVCFLVIFVCGCFILYLT